MDKKCKHKIGCDLRICGNAQRSVGASSGGYQKALPRRLNAVLIGSHGENAHGESHDKELCMR